MLCTMRRRRLRDLFNFLKFELVWFADHGMMYNFYCYTYTSTRHYTTGIIRAKLECSDVHDTTKVGV